MRSTNEIIADLKGNKRPDYEELRMACLVQSSLLFFKSGDIKRLLKGGIGAELTKRDYPGACAGLGISEREYNAMKMDPMEYLGAANIPGTPEYEAHYKVSKKILEKFAGGCKA